MSIQISCTSKCSPPLSTPSQSVPFITGASSLLLLFSHPHLQRECSKSRWPPSPRQREGTCCLSSPSGGKGTSLAQLLRDSPLLAELADIHVVIVDLPMQFNLWRNIARLYSPAKSVLALDVDFVTDPHLHTFIIENWDTLVWPRMSKKKVAFVVPAFEPANSDDSYTDSDRHNKWLPISKQEVVAMTKRGELRMFHESWYHGQGHTNYTRWLDLGRESQEIYPVQTYHFKYEPYVLVTQDSPFCDERFIGYGSNKCACIYELKAAGFTFAVLPAHFVIHHPHPSDGKREGTGAREKENQLNLETMKSFMRDMENKYGYRAPH